RTCKKCGAIYHLIYSPPKKPGICDKCGGELYQRDDDKEETVRERFRVYRKNTEPLIDYYKKKGVLYDVDGTKDIEGVKKEVFGILEKIKP
ncbi:MAG: nucleoside monophosphate kinase, partial [Archaeoglobaceae archaeon]